MNGFSENTNQQTNSQAIIASVEKFSGLIPKDSIIPFLKEIELHLNAGENFTDAMHKTMTRYKINWNDENYQSVAYDYKENLEQIQAQNEQDVADYAELYKEDILAGAKTNEENLTSNLDND